ncbi:sugar nucleotide-binding protein [Micromonospora sp. M61]|uniref:SDR family oxidoreductase n=1 Tax=Micromonospora sp. M61 TaxID=2824890 RepID=UPI001B39B23C|nr:sugar nucleotide-binding protein [Micromonospora sp. M61]MBQ0977941.1 sugar nucleotide-binding protein [Micromonospora sp. M61]
MRVLVVGSGFVGRTVAGAVVAGGNQAVLASRHRPAGVAAWVELDVTDADACAAVMRDIRPDGVVAVHGPSDVTWCEEHPDEARQAHLGSTENLVRTARDARLVQISTDNVFDGGVPGYDETARPAAANAYGRAKLAAERASWEHGDSTVLRVSLIYGPESPAPGRRPNFVAHCAQALRAGRSVTVPDRQWTTPVHVDDVAAVTVAALGGAPPLLHLGGPRRISRVDWAYAIADRVGATGSMVKVEPKESSRYACRPVNSCLTSVLLPDLLDRWGLTVRDVDAGLVASVGAAA